MGLRHNNILNFPALENKVAELIDEKIKDTDIPLPDIQETVNDAISKTREFDESVGNRWAYGSIQSEIEASSVTSNESILKDDFNTLDNSFFKKPTKIGRCIAINHDDFPITDKESIRMLLNKYRITSTFSYIHRPFPNLSQKNKDVANIKKLIADGNEGSIPRI